MPGSWIAAHLGETAALGTALCWTGSALAFEAAARRMGALSLNLVRLAIGLAMLTLLAALVRGRPDPLDVAPTAAAWLAASGLVGLVFGDLCLFRAFVLIGARRSMLILTVTPAIAALIAWPVLGERLSLRDLAGMALTAAGVVVAVAARIRDPAAPPPALWPGVALALGGALGQAGGLVLAKIGLPGVHPVAGTQIRLGAGVIGFAVVISLSRRWRPLRAALRDRGAVGVAALGAFLGPCLGVSLSLYAVTHAPAGVAASLMALTPVFLVPVARLRGEPVGLAGILGPLLAVAGVVVLTR
jgi:drug/metabolite transporter (DMT)-like permease